MATFLRVLSDSDKQEALLQAISTRGENVFDVEPKDFGQITGAPFAYWVSGSIRSAFSSFPPFESESRKVLGGLKTLSDFRFLRCWWEPSTNTRWEPIAKGGVYSPYYADLSLVVIWESEGEDISWYGYQRRPREGFGGSSRGKEAYFRPGITWGRRTQAFGPRLLPGQAIFSDKGPVVCDVDDDQQQLLSTCGIMLSKAYSYLIATRLNAADATARSYEVGVIQATPTPPLTDSDQEKLAKLTKLSWRLRRVLDTVEETSHAFVLPMVLQKRQWNLDVSSIPVELNRIQSDIDEIVFDLYEFTEFDRQAILVGGSEEANLAQYAEASLPAQWNARHPIVDFSVLSWAVGVVFSRFDCRLAIGEREAPPEPGPFDPLPPQSPGMLPDGVEQFHHNQGLLVDDPGSPHDLPQLIESVLERVEMPTSDNLRRWLQKDFFKEHLKQYSKSRRKAPIYWPLSSSSGSYTLWVYYPALDDQTLYTAVNDFLEPRLKSVEDVLTTLRAKTGRSATEEREFEKQQNLQQELVELRDSILAIASDYQPSLDDGVQITAAPLWQLFHHKPWQKVLRDTWEKLEAGEYDWAHLAYSYWPDRVSEKCKTDKSLAIAHGLEELYEEPAA